MHVLKLAINAFAFFGGSGFLLVDVTGPCRPKKAEGEGILKYKKKYTKTYRMVYARVHTPYE